MEEGDSIRLGVQQYMICKHILLMTFLNKPKFFFPHKWFQVLLYNSHDLTSVIYLHIFLSIWPIDKTQSSANTPGQGRPRSNGNEGVLHILQISKASDALMSYLGHSLGWGLARCSDALGVFYSLAE